MGFYPPKRKKEKKKISDEASIKDLIYIWLDSIKLENLFWNIERFYIVRFSSGR